MSLWNFLGAAALFEWLFGSNKKDKSIKNSPYPTAHNNYSKKEHLDRIQYLENCVEEFRHELDDCHIYSDRYSELEEEIEDLQDEIDVLQDELDEL